MCDVIKNDKTPYSNMIHHVQQIRSRSFVRMIAINKDEIDFFRLQWVMKKVRDCSFAVSIKKIDISHEINLSQLFLNFSELQGKAQSLIEQVEKSPVNEIDFLPLLSS